MTLLRSGSLLLIVILIGNHDALGGGAKPEQSKEAMQAIQEYVGTWKGSGTSEKNKSDIWKESATWTWKFDKKEAFFAAEMKESKLYKAGEIRYLADKKHYQLTLTTQKDKKEVYIGELKKDRLSLERVDADTKETHQIQFNTASDGDRLIMTFAVKPENRTLFNKTSQVAYTREGVTFAAAGAKKNECVVTGGLGTSTVMYKGVTYWVCCTGCRDAFNENPEKIIKEYQARKKAGG
jgi:hypothetical protein